MTYPYRQSELTAYIKEIIDHDTHTAHITEITDRDVNNQVNGWKTRVTKDQKVLFSDGKVKIGVKVIR